MRDRDNEDPSPVERASCRMLPSFGGQIEMSGNDFTVCVLNSHKKSLKSSVAFLQLSYLPERSYGLVSTCRDPATTHLYGAAEMANGNSDIKLLPGQVKVEAWDLCLDSQDRRKEHEKPFRRAFVHDFNDGLTVNWDRDYPGGVTIQGVVTVPGHLEVPGSTTLSGAARLEGGLEVFGDTRLEGKLEVRQLFINMVVSIRGPQGVMVPVTIQVDVGKEISDLKQKITGLEQQLAAVKAKIGL